MALILSLSFGLITESFRYQSTARLWEDDYDLLFDPARIPQIEGSRLWTSLANFVSGSEEMFSNGSHPYLLLGGTTSFGTWYPGFVYDRSSSKDPMATGLDDPYGNPIYGEGFVRTINYNNPDSLGNFQFRETTEDQRFAFDAHAWSDYYVAIGTQMNDMRFGFGYMHEDHKGTYTDPANNYRYYNYTEDLRGSSDTLFGGSDSAVYAGDNITTSSNNEFILSGWMDKENWSAGLTFTYEMISSDEEAIINGFEADYANPDPSTFYTTTDVIDSLTIPESGSEIEIDAKLFYNYSETAQGRFYLGYFTRSTSYGDDATSYYNEFIEADLDPYLWQTNNTTFTNYAGDFSSSGFRAGTKQLFHVSDRFRFGIGLLWSSSSINDTTYTQDSTVDMHEWFGDTLIVDTVITSWSGESWAMTREGSINSFVIPVGVEFNVTDPFVFRMGATHTLAKNNITTAYTFDDAAWQQQVTHIVIDDTIEAYVYPDPGARPEDTQEDDNATISSTNYYYGFGWMVTDNLQIDVMNFSDITDWVNWRVSATFHFD